MSKHYDVWQNTKEKGAHCFKFTAENEADAYFQGVVNTLEGDHCMELTEEMQSQIRELFDQETGYVFFPYEDSDKEGHGYVVWKLEGDNIGIGETTDGTDRGTDKWENFWLECKYIKEQIATTCYVVTDDSLAEVAEIDDSISLPETIEMGVFRYENGDIKVENL